MRHFDSLNWILKLSIALGFLSTDALASSRIKDIASMKGVRDNQLVGYGLVVGLKGTGDSKISFTGASMSRMLKTLGVNIKQEEVHSKNVAAVIVTAKLPPFVRTGSKIDVSINSIGDAKSLQGGTLVYTPLRGGDSAIYAVAQGAVSINGFSAGGGGSSSSKNHPTVGVVPEGAVVEKEVATDFSNRNALRWSLNRPDFTSAARMAKVINQELGGIFARARDASTVDVVVPYDFEGGPVELVAMIERLPMQEDEPARVLVNEKTGTVIIGKNVTLSPVAVAHGELTVEVQQTDTTTQTLDFGGADLRNPASATDGSLTRERVKETRISVNEGGDKLIYVPEASSLGDVVRGLNALGVSPRDLIAILQALKSQGALKAELEIL